MVEEEDIVRAMSEGAEEVLPQGWWTLQVPP
jgi:hypothetical protein